MLDIPLSGEYSFKNFRETHYFLENKMPIEKKDYKMTTFKLYDDVELEVDRIQLAENRPSRSNTIESLLVRGVQKTREDKHPITTIGQG